MSKARRGNLLLVLMMALISMLSCFFGTLMLTGGKKISASAETVEYQDYLGIEDRTSWASGGHADIVTFGLMDFSITEGAQYFKSSVSGCWYHGNNDVVTANSGLDILQYVYLNGESARDLITQNATEGKSTAGTGYWLSNPAAWPIAFETGADCWIRIDKTKFGGNFTFTLKEGFTLIRNDGVVCSISNDISYTYENGTLGGRTLDKKYTLSFDGTDISKKLRNDEAIGELPEVPAKDGYGGFWTINGTVIDENTTISSNTVVTPVYGLEYEDLLGLEDRTSWGAHDGEVYFGGVTLSPFGYFNTHATVAATWHADTTAPITSNAGVDIMKYIYVNGECARDLIVANYKGTQNKNACDCWLKNPAAWPVYVETTTGSGIMIRLAKAYFGDTITFTFKKGFSLVRNDGERIYVSSDITYTYENGTLGGRTVDKQYTLSFDGTDVSKKLSNGATIGELPEVPAKDGYEGVWTIDGVEITAGTVYNYGANKTATVVYYKNITETIGFGDWGVPESESDLRYLWIRDNNAEIATAYPNSYWNDHEDNKDSNYGVDIMEYILIDGESVRSIINANAAGTTSYKAASTFPLNIGGCYAPICIETAGDGIRFKVMVDYKTSFKVTFKAGFTLVNAEGIRLYVSEDVVYNVGATAGDISKVTGYTLTFEGVETRNIEGGATIGELPTIPEKEGCTAVWMIDGLAITADTVYNYNANKTAKIVYSKDITATIGLGDWGVPESESDIRYLWIRNNDAEIATAYPCEYWNDHEDNKNSNYGVDIMEYILIDGESVRSIINANAAGTTSYKAASTFPLNNGGCYAPIALSTLGDGVRFKVMVDYKTAFALTFKAGFTIVDAEGVRMYTTEDVVFAVGEGGFAKVMECTLSFEGLDDTVTVIGGQAIGELPKAPEKEGCEGYWTIDGVAIDENTVYNYGMDKTAVAAYRKDISKYIALEDRTSWGACAEGGEYYFGVLDMSTISKDGNGNDVNYINTNNADCWYHGNNAPIDANGGVDIMQYIYINDTSARDLITANVNGDNLVNGCPCWLSNPAASPVYVQTTTGSGIMIKVLQAYVGNYFEITFKSGFSIVNTDGVTVYLTKDVTYKYIVTAEGTTFAKGELTDDDLDMLNGQYVTLMNGTEEILVKKTARLTLPELDPVPVDNGLTQVLVGWTTDPTNLSNLYPIGYKMDISEEIELHAVWIGFEMQDGAAVRTTKDSAGIRFLTDIDAAAYKLGVEKGLIRGVGTFIVPTDYLETTGLEPTHSNFKGSDDLTYYLDKPTETWRVNGESDATWTYAAALVNIKEYQYARQMSARGYLKIQFTTGEGYVYTPYNEENNARSIYEVATLAYNDEENPQYKTNETILNYINNVADLIWDNYEFVRNDKAVGEYSIDEIRSEGNTVTVIVDNDITSAVINGKRLASGSSSNVPIGDLLFNVSGFEVLEEETGFKFTLGAANKVEKDSEDSLYFASSNADLDFFLNDFFKRHSGVIEDGVNQKVNSVTAGVSSEEFFSHEWMSMSYYWYNSFDGYTDEKGNISNRIEGLRNFLSSVPVDDYGYVWSSNDRVRDAYTDVRVGEQKMGWPFPNNDTVDTKHWEFNSSNESWSNNISASASGGLYGKNLSNQSSNITFTSNSFGSWSSNKVYTFYAPLLEFEVRIDNATNIEDIYVWYSTSSSTSFSEDKKVSVKDKAFLNYDLGNTSGAYNHVLYLPMYAESAWGESTSTYMKQLKIEIALKSGKTISGNVALNYVRPTLDTRMSNNNSILISSLRQDYDFTGDLDYLKENITRARKAMNFLMQMYDSNRGLKRESYLVGHGGTKESLNWLGNATNKSIASSISQGYWDIMYMPEYDFQSNTYFYKALRDMAYLEEVLANNDITVNEDATVKTATRNRTTGTSAYSYDLNSVANTVLTNLRQTTENTNHTGFWNATNGRFVAGYASDEGKWYDYGYAAWNLEAIYYGIATEEQATAIMNWLNSEGALYDYVFAPKSITVTGDADALNGEYAAQGDKWVNCQFGGAILYTSFYDLMARIDTLGADNAFARLTAIQKWYKEVYDYYVANGTDPYDFYRYYYDNKGIQCQGLGTAGEVGLDREFLESFLPVSAVAYGFFGIEANGSTLTIAPEMPEELSSWKMENLAFNFVKYDLTIFADAIQLNNVRVKDDARGDVTGLKLTVALDYTEGQLVYVNGIECTNYTVENGKAYVTVDMGATIVEVK